MFSLNRIDLIGYQTQPVALRKTPGGASVADLNIAVPYEFKSGTGETVAGKSFHSVTMWGPMAEVAGQFVRPGSQVFISGRLQTDSWEDESTKEKKSKTKITALELILLDPKDGLRPSKGIDPMLTSAQNRASIIGNVTRDPEVRTTANGTSVVTLGIATNERWKDKASGEAKERTEFHSVVIWGDLATKVAASAKKGQRAFASGRVQTRTWETKEGQKRATTEIIADQLSILGLQAPASLSGNVRETSDRAASSDASPKSSPAPASSGIPEITYASEVKPEDLPF